MYKCLEVIGSIVDQDFTEVTKYKRCSGIFAVKCLDVAIILSSAWMIDQAPQDADEGS